MQAAAGAELNVSCTPACAAAAAFCRLGGRTGLAQASVYAAGGGGFLPDISPLIVGSHKNTSSQRRQFTDSQAQPLQGLEPGLRADDRLCTAALLTLLLLLLLPWIKPQHQARHTCPLTTHCIAVPGLPHPRPAASGQRTLDPVLVDHVCQSRPPRLACLCVRVVEAAEGE